MSSEKWRPQCLDTIYQMSSRAYGMYCSPVHATLTSPDRTLTMAGLYGLATWMRLTIVSSQTQHIDQQLITAAKIRNKIHNVCDWDGKNRTGIECCWQKRSNHLARASCVLSNLCWSVMRDICIIVAVRVKELPIWYLRHQLDDHWCEALISLFTVFPMNLLLFWYVIWQDSSVDYQRNGAGPLSI